MTCDCCKVSVYHRCPTRAVIECDGWWYPSWGEFARVLGMPRDVVRKRVERRMCLRRPVRVRRRREDAPQLGSLLRRWR